MTDLIGLDPKVDAYFDSLDYTNYEIFTAINKDIVFPIS